MTIDDCFNSICVPHPACCSISDFLAEICLQFKYSNCMCLYPIRILGYGYSFGSSMKKRHVLVGNIDVLMALGYNCIVPFTSVCSFVILERSVHKGNCLGELHSCVLLKCSL